MVYSDYTHENNFEIKVRKQYNKTHVTFLYAYFKMKSECCVDANDS